ncbi:MAG: alpha/beta hydrolase domain-containing protein, partial [Bryobacteraceae bacterium]
MHWLCSTLLVMTLAAQAAVVRVEVKERSDVLAGKAFGSTGPYVRLTGKIRFAADPTKPANQLVTDIGYAPRNAAGKVEYSADFYALVPRDPAKGNGAVLYEVSNRGRKGLLGTFCRGDAGFDPRLPGHFGDGFLLERGFALFWMGWQFDVPPERDLLRFYAPVARDGGRPITGVVRSDFVPDKIVTTIHLADRTHIPYRAINPADPSIQLTVRDLRLGPRTVIPRAEWQFAKEENGQPVPVDTHVYMRAGFQPGRIYEIVYRSQDPPVAGLGLAATRDLISFLKHGGADGPLGDLHLHIKRAIGIGSSQSGRFLRKFLYDGFNQDESGRQVFDGVWAHVAGGGRGSFNHRFAQPSRDARPFFNFFYPTDIFPFTDVEQTDPETGITDGILVRSRKANVVPRIFYTNSSYEYYGRSASLIHTTPDGKKDVPPAPLTRIYLIAGAQHGPGSFPPHRNGTRQPANSNDYRWTMRALLVAMDRWIATGKEPPPSRYPKADADQLVPLGALNFPKLPGVPRPDPIQTAHRVDYGPDFRTRGIVSVEPPKLGPVFGMRVPQVDTDGNETSGVRLPVVQVPLATYTGWNFRDPSIGAPGEFYSMVGSTLEFARTRAERVERGDPRPSREERYGSLDEYLKKLDTAARSLAGEGFVLESDVPLIVKQAAE